MTHTFTIHGKPAGWRIVHNTQGKTVRTNLVKNAKAWRKRAVKSIRAAWDGVVVDEPAEVRVLALFPRPKRLTCSHKRECSCSGPAVTGERVPYATTPDATNVHKLAEDALVVAGVLSDDRIVYRYSGECWYAGADEEPMVVVAVDTFAAMAQKEE